MQFDVAAPAGKIFHANAEAGGKFLGNMLAHERIGRGSKNDFAFLLGRHPS